VYAVVFFTLRSPPPSSPFPNEDWRKIIPLSPPSSPFPPPPPPEDKRNIRNPQSLFPSLFFIWGMARSCDVLSCNLFFFFSPPANGWHSQFHSSSSGFRYRWNDAGLSFLPILSPLPPFLFIMMADVLLFPFPTSVITLIKEHLPFPPHSGITE